MCGIAGIYDPADAPRQREEFLQAALAMLRHRGPDGAGIYLDRTAGLAHARLSIIDLAGGRQPIANEDETIWVTCNGEVFNYLELRRELLARGHHFRTGSDSEVIVHLYEEQGSDCVQPLVGDFAFAIWDSRERRLLLARDRVGVRPLYYSVAVPGAVHFASEIKALLADPRIGRELDLGGLDQVFTYWSTLPGRTVFSGIREVPPGHVLLADRGGVRLQRYWSLDFEPDQRSPQNESEYAAELEALLVDATRIRLRGDVPVGAYLSGGLDSSAIAGIVRRRTGNVLESFSVAFANATFDEREYQQLVARDLGVRHHVLQIEDLDVGAAFPEVIWHAETALLRTAPAPLLLLSAFVRRQGFKVVLTGEGADEFLGGYDIFKEAKVRAFWARQPASSYRPLLLRRLYGHVPELAATPLAYLQAHFGRDLEESAAPFFSHLGRWRATAQIKRFLSADIRASLAGVDHSDELFAALDGLERDRDPVTRAQHLEAAIFLPQYLLSSQGDRVSLANAVEGRFPFLDHRLIEFCNRLPPTLKIRGLEEKYLFKRAARDFVPETIRRRPKQPYRAPIVAAFLGNRGPAYVHELLEPAALAQTGYFNLAAVAALVAKAERTGRLSEHDSMALTGIISMQLLHRQFIEPSAMQAEPASACTVVVQRDPEAVPA